VSLLALDLLRLSAPTEDIAFFKCNVQRIWRAYPEAVIDRELRTLREDGLIHELGLPRKGWLTTKGRAALARPQHR
jgi:hypothetical protein